MAKKQHIFRLANQVGAEIGLCMLLGRLRGFPVAIDDANFKLETASGRAASRRMSKETLSIGLLE